MNIHKHRIALVAHDNLKSSLVNWTKANRQVLAECELFATGTTGTLITEQTGLGVTCFLSGPYGGDQQIGAKISEGLIDILIFFWDPMTPVPHDADVKALLRLATMLNIPLANNQSTADCVLAMLKLVKTESQPWIVNFNASGKTSPPWSDNYSGNSPVPAFSPSPQQYTVYSTSLKQSATDEGKAAPASQLKYRFAPAYPVNLVRQKVC